LTFGSTGGGGGGGATGASTTRFLSRRAVAAALFVGVAAAAGRLGFLLLHLLFGDGGGGLDLLEPRTRIRVVRLELGRGGRRRLGLGLRLFGELNLDDLGLLFFCLGHGL
jgi:hypothetical protein